MLKVGGCRQRSWKIWPAVWTGSSQGLEPRFEALQVRQVSKDVRAVRTKVLTPPSRLAKFSTTTG